MKEKSLRTLSREELLQLLIERTQERDAMQARAAELQSQLDEANARLEHHTLAIENAGSLAEAALQVNGVVEAAQKAADQYLENIERMHREQADACAKLEEQSSARAAQLIAQAEARCREMEEAARRRCDELVRAAERDAGRNWEEVSSRLDRIGRENESLRELLSNQTKKRKWRL